MSHGFSRRTFLAGACCAPLGHRISRPPVSREGDRFLEDLSRRAFLFFADQANPNTGLVLDRARAAGGAESRQIASSAATGFGLSGLCIAAARGWLPAASARDRVLATLRFYANESFHEHGWFYHFVNAATGERVWNCEISSIDTALLLAGILTAKQYFGDSEIGKLADQIYGRIDFRWMLNGDPLLLSMGYKPESGFLDARWATHSELGILYLVAIGSPTYSIPAESWFAWSRPRISYAGYDYISGTPPLFVHQYSQAWVDFRKHRDKREPHTNWFDNSVIATRAHRQACIDLARKFPGYSENVWGITASDSAKGYVAWGTPPPDPAIDGTVVPCAPGGSLMFAPDICLPALQTMQRRFGDRAWQRYGFVDAFHPANGWTNPDVIGINQGITLLSAENLRSGNVWTWFMRNDPVRRALESVSVPA